MNKKIRFYKNKYYSIRSIFCDSLKERAYFNNYGFNHLIRKGRKYRTKEERVRRFALLLQVKGVLEKGIVVDYKKLNKVKFWAIKHEDITVILRKSNNKELHFYSIFDK